MERFWSKVDKSGDCWIWTGAAGGVRTHRYGSIVIGSRTDGSRKNVAAHRLSYEMHKGEIPEGLCICHTCDNTLCVNPDHLFAATHLENMTDMYSKCRRTAKGRKGTDHHAAKLTEAEVLNIRKRVARGEMQKTVAEDYGIHKVSVSQIITRKRWKHI